MRHRLSAPTSGRAGFARSYVCAANREPSAFQEDA